MLEIYLYGRHTSRLTQLRKIIYNYILLKPWDIELAICTSSKTHFIEYAETSKNIGIYYLDITSDEHNDIVDIIQFIRKKDSRGFIAFTYSDKRFLEKIISYNSESISYILFNDNTSIKTHVNFTLLLAYQRYTSQHLQNNNSLCIQLHEKMIFLSKDNILFIKATGNNHQLEINTLDNRYTVYDTLKHIQESLTPDFVRCHNSYIVNIKQIKYINRHQYIICLINDKLLPVSVRRLSNLLDSCNII